MALDAALIANSEDLEPLSAEWDALAVAAGRPYCTPAWMLAWWRHVGRSRVELRAVAVRQQGKLVALAPFFATPRRAGGSRYQLLAAGSAHRIEPLAAPEVEEEAARAISSLLAKAEPRPTMVSFENIDQRFGWPTLLAQAWPGATGDELQRTWSGPAPTLQLENSSFDAWLAGKSRNYRSRARRARRQLDAHGARFRLAASEEELERGLEEFARLHHARWENRGGSVAINPGIERMLAEAGRHLLASGRFRLFSIEVDGRAIASTLFVAAGGELSYWNGGFDTDWAEQQPSLRCLEWAIRDGFERGDRRLDLGGGGQHYKLRLADGGDKLETVLLLPPGPRRLLTRMHLAPQALARRGRRRLGRT